jgi:undecaprenyl-diphosphatase
MTKPFKSSLLNKPWPFGLAGPSTAIYVALLGAALALLYLIDHPLSVWGTGLPPEIRQVFDVVTGFGESGWILVPSLLVLLIALGLYRFTRGRLNAALVDLAALSGFIFTAVGLPGLVATLLKRAIGRGRPETFTDAAPLVFTPNWSAFPYQSFPSGHATTAFGFAMVVAFIWPRSLRVALACAGLVAVSRVIVGAHYPTDITAGAVLGVLGTYGVRNLFAARNWLFTRAPDGTYPRKPLNGLQALFAPQAPR